MLPYESQCPRRGFHWNFCKVVLGDIKSCDSHGLAESSHLKGGEKALNVNNISSSFVPKLSILLRSAAYLIRASMYINLCSSLLNFYQFCPIVVVTMNIVFTCTACDLPVECRAAFGQDHHQPQLRLRHLLFYYLLSINVYADRSRTSIPLHLCPTFTHFGALKCMIKDGKSSAEAANPGCSTSEETCCVGTRSWA